MALDEEWSYKQYLLYFKEVLPVCLLVHTQEWGFSDGYDRELRAGATSMQSQGEQGG